LGQGGEDEEFHELQERPALPKKKKGKGWFLGVGNRGGGL